MKPFSWHELFVPTMAPWEVVFRAAFVYVAVHVLLRLAGRKELARYSVFDAALLFLITVAMRRSVVGEDSTLTTAVLALGTIIGMDRLFSLATFKSRAVKKVLQGDPRPLIRDGQVLEDELREVQFTRRDLESQVRLKGHESLSEVKTAFLEPNGQVSFIFKKG
jgi:uncharacterized membrane protein YcaP (DUF421 family)